MALALIAALPLTAIAHGGTRLPTRIDLPDGFMPEGIESRGARLYAGSLAGGAIWTASAVSGTGRMLVEPVAGSSAAGLHIDQRGRLWVAGGPSQQVRVYSTRTGALLRTSDFPTTGFINDLDISGNTVYATDSVNQQLAVIPLGRAGRLPAPSAATTLPLTGDIAYQAGFNANGMVARGGKLILVQSNTGLLFRVDPRTGSTTTIETGGRLFVNGDGLERVGSTLYVVRNQDEIVDVLRLSAGSAAARFIGSISKPDATDVPTTATVALGSLWVVNARFGTTDPQPADYWITRPPMRP
jgi:sugar lactone lactonase YvrE